MIVITKVAGEVNVYATLCLCLMILGVVCVVLLQCIYRVTKNRLRHWTKQKNVLNAIQSMTRMLNSARSAVKNSQSN